jgi:TatD DNase family protein
MKTAGRDYTGVYPAFGIHPMHAGLADDACLSRLESFAQQAVALGEIGLDPAYQIPMEQQEHAFRQQLRLALRLGLPVLIHCRRAFQRTLQILREERIGQVGGIMHAYSGSPEMAREFIKLGLAISLSGIITHDSARRPLRVVQEIPLENLVLETDAPDLTPQRYLGLSNRPAHLPEILLAVARMKNISVFEAALVCYTTTIKILPAVGQS